MSNLGLIIFITIVRSGFFFIRSRQALQYTYYMIL